MAHEISVPRLGWTMEEGTFGGWLKAEGDFVRSSDEIYTLESDKASQGIEALAEGVLRIAPDGPQTGDIVKVGAVLGCLTAIGEPAPWETPAAVQDVRSTTTSIRVTLASAAVVPKAPATVESGDPAPVAKVHRGPAISPRARRAARELGIDASHLQGSGATGRITERDVRLAAQSGAAPQVESPMARPSPRTARPTSDTLVPITPVRRLIAERMLAGSQAMAPVTLTTKADVAQLKAIRDQFKGAPPGKQAAAPSYTALLVKLAAAVLEQHPRLNSCWEGAHIREFAAINVCVAIDAPGGLVAPALRDVPSLTLLQTAEAIVQLAQRARDGKLRTEDFEGGTFTITNLGMHGIDAFTPILNVPQTAILGLGRIVAEPAVRDGKVVPRDAMTVCLTFDHRAVDGAPAARFLNDLRQAIEEPFPWLLAD